MTPSSRSTRRCAATRTSRRCAKGSPTAPSTQLQPTTRRIPWRTRKGVGGGGVRDDRSGDRVVRRRCGDGRDRPAGLGGRRRSHERPPGPHRAAVQPRPAPGRRCPGEPRADRPECPVGRGRGAFREPQPQHAVRWPRATGSRGRDVPARARHGSRREARMTAQPAILVLEDGRTFRGEAYGATGETFGEAVFNTGMTGYQETLTDPSYHRQVVIQTAPHIGNTGINDEDRESRRIWVSGYVVRDPARIPSSWRSRRSLDD